MTALQSKIVKVIKSKRINVFFLFFLLAFIILVLTKLSREYTNTITFNVKPENVPEEVIVLNDSTHQLKVTLTTYGFKWLNYYLKTPRLEIDFNEDVNKTEDYFIWSQAKGFSGINEQFDKNTIIKSINPDTLRFKYDTNAIKYIPVKINTEITYSPGYDILEPIKTTPDSIKVIGPKTMLSKLVSIETEPLILKNVKTPIQKTLNLKVNGIDKKVKLDYTSVQVSATVERFTEGTISVPVLITNVPKGIKLKHFPKNVNVSYYTSLEAFNTIDLMRFKVICNYKDLRGDSTYLTPLLIEQPEGVKSTRLHQKKIEFIITE
ncbi:YbbR-like domain-containing protein [Pontimicrobium sp. MEBiC01747]